MGRGVGVVYVPSFGMGGSGGTGGAGEANMLFRGTVVILGRLGMLGNVERDVREEGDDGPTPPFFFIFPAISDRGNIPLTLRPSVSDLAV